MGEVIQFERVWLPFRMERTEPEVFYMLRALEKPRIKRQSSSSTRLSVKHVDGLTKIFFEAQGECFFGECQKSVFDEFWHRNRPFNASEFFILCTAM